MTNLNERTHFFTKNISLTLYSRKSWCWLGMRDEPETGTDCYIDPAVLHSHLGWGCSTVVHWGPKALCLALNSAYCLQLAQAVCVLVILLFTVHLLPLFFRLFTQVHLLIDGSVEGQYVTYRGDCHVIYSLIKFYLLSLVKFWILT